MSSVSISTHVKTCQLILNSQTSVPTSFSYKGPPVTSKASKLIAGNPLEQSGFVNLFQVLALQFFVNQHHFVRYEVLNFALRCCWQYSWNRASTHAPRNSAGCLWKCCRPACAETGSCFQRLLEVLRFQPSSILLTENRPTGFWRSCWNCCRRLRAFLINVRPTVSRRNPWCVWLLNFLLRVLLI